MNPQASSGAAQPVKRNECQLDTFERLEACFRFDCIFLTLRSASSQTIRDIQVSTATRQTESMGKRLPLELVL